MKCSKCGTENLMKASYCKNCGARFSDAEKQQAKNDATVTKLKKAEERIEQGSKLADILTLKFITENVYVRLALIVLPFVLSLIISGGDKSAIKIRESDQYRLRYEAGEEMYYVDVDTDTVNLLLYVPKDTQSVQAYFTDLSGVREDTMEFSLDRCITLPAREDGFYTVSAILPGGCASLEMCVE